MAGEKCLAGLAAADHPPKKLFFWGRWDAKLFGWAAAVVGSRRMTEYGRRVTEKLVPGLVEAGMTVVLGFMYGVDRLAHETCLACGGRTVAVLGWGAEYRGMSAEEEELVKQICDGGGLVISEWKTQVPALWTFPQRNRIVAGLVGEVYVVEAAEKSGALITVDLARSLGKTIWAVPGPVTSRVSEGTNRLIAEGTAKMWLPQQQTRMETSDAKRVTKNVKIYSLLENEALTVNDLVRKLNQPAAEVMAELTGMLLAGEILEKEGKYFAAG